jgi:hypothetical protein
MMNKAKIRHCEVRAQRGLLLFRAPSTLTPLVKSLCAGTDLLGEDGDDGGVVTAVGERELHDSGQFLS